MAAAAASLQRMSSFVNTFEPPITPADWMWPVSGVVAYLITVKLLKTWAAARKAQGLPLPNLRGVMIAHNAMLSVGSLVLLVAFLYELVPKYLRLGSFFELACNEEMGRPGLLYFLYYVNYFFKYYEFVDTFFMAVRGKATPFLHVYHHAATLLLVYVSMTEKLGVAWLPIVLNLGVHVVMYYYYMLQAMGIRVWWKKHVTTLQISQFVLDLYGCFYCFGYRLIHGHESCQGTDYGAIWGCGILSSYLVLFINFFVNTYSEKRASNAAKAKAKSLKQT